MSDVPIEPTPTVYDSTNTVVCVACSALVPVDSQAQHFAWHWDIETRLKEYGPVRRATPTGVPVPQRVAPQPPVR